ncbi:MAG: AI-2E family transporter [Gemmatimonadaceae bacterium]|nr:AI-2E family transporter [Gemmatimonadaceae bacterium]
MDFLHSKQQRAGLLIILLGIAIVYAVAPFASGLLGSAVLYVLCVPVYRRLARRLNADLAAAITLVGAIVVIAFPIGWIIFLAADQLPDALRSAQQSAFFQRVSELRVGRIQIGNEIAKASGSLIQWVSGQAFDLVGGAAKATLNLVISFFALYYMLLSANRSWRVFRRVLPFSEDTADELRTRFYSVTHATLLGTALTALLQGTLIGIGFRVVGFPNAALWGVVTAFCSILPVLGSAMVWLPGTLVLALEQQYGMAAILFVIGAVFASNIDNVIRPIVFKRVSNIHPMITLVGAFAGVTIFGLLGILLGPLAIQYFFVLVRLYREEYIDKQVTRTMEMKIPHPLADPTWEVEERDA